MARLRLLFALLLVAVGSTFGAFALSGYFEPPVTHGQPVVAPDATPRPAERPQLGLSHARHRLIGVDDRPAVALPAKAKPAAKSTPVKPKLAIPRPPPVKDGRPQQAAAPWPWDPFRN